MYYNLSVSTCQAAYALTVAAARGIWPAAIVTNGARGCRVSMNAAVAFMNVQPRARRRTILLSAATVFKIQ